LNAAWPRLLGAVLVLSGCYWSRYPELMETHLVLLEQYAAKLDSLARTEDGVPLEGWAEFTYPLERARDFARIAARRYAGRASLQSFRVVLDRYAALVDEPAFLLRPGAVATIGTRRAELERAVAKTREDLAREREG
jgi:hypothetical protein